MINITEQIALIQYHMGNIYFVHWGRYVIVDTLYGD